MMAIQIDIDDSVGVGRHASGIVTTKQMHNYILE